VFAGNTADPMTLATQIEKLKQRFNLDHVVLVGDRGMITQARITEDIKSAGLDWISSLRAPAIRELVEGGALQLSLFDQREAPAPAKAGGLHHSARLPRRAPGGLPQPRSRRRAHPQARRPSHRHRA
jgi:Transposase DDE domain